MGIYKEIVIKNQNAKIFPTLLNMIEFLMFFF